MMRLYDTMYRALRPFHPQDRKRITLYVCGPTVYAEPHLGNARPAVIFDVLFRYLRTYYGEKSVIYATNYTDVDDKIIDAAKFIDVRIDLLTNRVIEVFEESSSALNILPPTIRPRATHNIPAMVAMISRLIETGNAYVSGDHVFFSVASHLQGHLSGQIAEDHQNAVRIAASSLKVDPADFVLWKPSTDDQPGWESPWGYGRPGWHIECSAMIAAHLGETIDIHGGGVDLVFPHHEAENAQSSCIHGKPLANYWMHNGMVTVNGVKMSKSANNFVTVGEALARYDGEVLRYLLLSGHYRQPIDFSWEKMDAAKAALDRLYRVLEDTPDISPRDTGTTTAAALQDDLNTAGAIAAMHVLAASIQKRGDDASGDKADFLTGGRLLGILERTPDEWFGRTTAPDRVRELVAARAQARANKDWAASDALRTEIAEHGYTVEDSNRGTTWRRT